MVLVNRASDTNWTQEAVYLFFARELSKPDSFTAPRKIQDGRDLALVPVRVHVRHLP